MKTVIYLVMWYGTVHSGPTLTAMESLAKCEAVRVVMLQEYAPDGLINGEPGWTTNTMQHAAGKKSRCITVTWEE